MTIEQRLERLERQNRHMRWALSALIGLGITGCVAGLVISDEPIVIPVQLPVVVEQPSGADEVLDVIQARRFEVIGSDGRPVVTLSVNRDQTGGVVFTNNTNGALVAQMGAADDGRGVVWTYDCQGYRRTSRH